MQEIITEILEMQEIITEILERHGFPTKNVENLVFILMGVELSIEDLSSLIFVTTDYECIGFIVNDSSWYLSKCDSPFMYGGIFNRHCRLGSELVARLKGGER
jgi:hypothetical protein